MAIKSRSTAENFISSLRDPALYIQGDFGIPAGAIIAQAALESGWGNSKLAKQANNLFGIKAGSSWTGETVVMPTLEYQQSNGVAVPVRVMAVWRKYSSVGASLVDYAKLIFISPRYAGAIKAANHGTDPFAYADALQAAGYATDPNYAGKIKSIINQYNLENLK